MAIEYGIAAAYPNDVGLSGHSSVLLYEGWENAGWYSAGWDPAYENVDFGQRQTDPNNSRLGTCSLESKNVSGTHLPYGFDLDFSDASMTEADECFIRWYRKFQSGYYWTCQVKTPGLYAILEEIPAGQKPDGYDVFSCKLQIYPYDDGYSGEPKFYTYHVNQAGDYGDSWAQNVGNNIYVAGGDWHCYEIQLKANTVTVPDVGDANGEIRLWIDGELRGEYTGMVFRHTTDLKINQVNVKSYVGGTCTAPQDEYIWDDALCVATEYIGPIVSSAMSTVNPEVATGMDDCIRYGATFQNNSGSIFCGNDGGWNDNGMRFALNVPAGATITAASLTLLSRLTNSPNTVRVRISYQDADNPADFTSDTTTSFDARARSSTYLDWEITTGWTAGVSYDSPDLSTVIQALVDEAYWDYGDHCVMFIDDNGSDASAYRRAYAYEGGYTAPILNVTYTTGGGAPVKVHSYMTRRQ